MRAFKESQYDLLAAKVRKSTGYGTDLPDDGEAGGRQMSYQYVLPGEIENVVLRSLRRSWVTGSFTGKRAGYQTGDPYDGGF